MEYWCTVASDHAPLSTDEKPVARGGYNPPARRKTTPMNDGHTRPTRTSKAIQRTELAVVMSIIIFLVVGPTVCAADSSSGDAIPVRLQLKWRHQFQFAGFYTALEKGYYRGPVSP
jgi:hypothetical protein